MADMEVYVIFYYYEVNTRIGKFVSFICMKVIIQVLLRFIR